MIKEFRTLTPLLRRYRRAYAAGVLSLLITSGAQLLIPFYVGSSIDLLLDGGGAGAVARPMGLLLITAIIIAITRFGWRFFIHGSSRRIEAELRENLYQQLLLLSPEFYNRTKTGDIMARATNDMRAIRMATGIALVAFIDGLFMTVAILAILFSRNPRLALVTIIPLPIITGLIIFLGERIGKGFRAVQEGFSHLSDQTQEVLSGIRVVKAFGKEPFFLSRFADANDRYQQQNMNLVKIWGLFFPLVSFLSGMTLLILLWFGGEALLEGSLTAGDFVATLGYLQMLTWPMLGAGFTVNMLQRGAASLSRINEILHTTPDIASPPGGRSTCPEGSLSVRNLSFSFPDQESPALQEISLELPAGGILGILGRTGSGKSTLISLFPRLLSPPEGTVFLDGTDVTQYDLNTLRGSFGIVPQRTFLFSATVRENIRFARPHASDAAIRHVEELAALDQDIGEFPQGWDTLVGERGVTLSGGQRQRIAIARALLPDPPILVLDDSLSAVDTRTEERLLQRILQERQGKTTIIVSNRISTLKFAREILVLEDGQVSNRGSHQELLAIPGLYRDIARLQQLEHIGEGP
ncbi:ATP-binding cassette, subfamily B [Alkalispirochaeta americana]|uniref:Multidrug resistance-like ATP-binding protein MdlA n=1 Tax=Alkalispirochaeta americana TaxID=159291 RepID=A0A1N6W3B3_9SPIO|nr:ABC transporter ATP-binding protein [Alkalispirochaeta americana]SIQ84472.1 ATP-binding cassette, subfamily B [Alkalispirochaeta americana]